MKVTKLIHFGSSISVKRSMGTSPQAGIHRRAGNLPGPGP